MICINSWQGDHSSVQPCGPIVSVCSGLCRLCKAGLIREKGTSKVSEVVVPLLMLFIITKIDGDTTRAEIKFHI